MKFRKLGKYLNKTYDKVSGGRPLIGKGSVGSMALRGVKDGLGAVRDGSNKLDRAMDTAAPVVNALGATGLIPREYARGYFLAKRMNENVGKGAGAGSTLATQRASTRERIDAASDLQDAYVGLKNDIQKARELANSRQPQYA